MNKKKWNALPPDIQKIFEQVSAEWIEKTGSAWDSTDQDGIKFITTEGQQDASALTKRKTPDGPQR